MHPTNHIMTDHIVTVRSMLPQDLQLRSLDPTPYKCCIWRNVTHLGGARKPPSFPVVDDSTAVTNLWHSDEIITGFVCPGALHSLPLLLDGPFVLLPQLLRTKIH
jgi:hypothetical protein